MKKFTLLVLACLGFNMAAMADEGLYFTLGETTPIGEKETVTLYSDVEYSNWDYVLATDSIMVHCNETLYGSNLKVCVSVRSLDEEHVMFSGLDDTNPETWGFTDPAWIVEKEVRMVKGHKEFFRIQVPVYSPQDDGYYYSGGIEIKVGRPECEDCYPVTYEDAHTFYLRLTNNPGAKASSIVSANSDKAAVRFNGRTLSYSLSGQTANVAIHSLDGRLMYSGKADKSGSLALDFLPAGVYTYKVGTTTGKMLVK